MDVDQGSRPCATGVTIHSHECVEDTGLEGDVSEAAPLLQELGDSHNGDRPHGNYLYKADCTRRADTTTGHQEAMGRRTTDVPWPQIKDFELSRLIPIFISVLY